MCYIEWGKFSQLKNKLFTQKKLLIIKKIFFSKIKEKNVFILKRNIFYSSLRIIRFFVLLRSFHRKELCVCFFDMF